MLYKVHNIREGERPHPAGYNSWIDYWEKRSGQAAGNCHKRRETCPNESEDGTHVQLTAEYEDATWYVVPMCHHHNTQFGPTMWVEGPLVPVDPRNPNIRW